MCAEAIATLLGKRYTLNDELGRGGMGIVYRALDQISGQTVALKRVIPPEQAVMLGTTSSVDGRVALAQEFQLLASLRHPHIISVLDYGFDDDHQPYYTMELVESARNILEEGTGKPLADQIGLIIQLLQALIYMHRRGVLHRDLKPSNVMVTAGHVRILDFGLSIMHRPGKDIQQAKREDESDLPSLSGTLAYMAPELLMGGTASRASDLYAVGLIAYELFTGTFPFSNETASTLITQALTLPPDLSIVPASLPVINLLERLLDKNPENRYSDAREVINDFNASLGQPAPAETAQLRESFLQAAQFVGREKETELLAHHLREALAKRGSAWLVGGESGVGKSRLLSEIRTLALVRSALVVRGQAISEGGSPYYLWQEALSWLSLLVDLSDTEAAVLKTILPTLPKLLDRSIPDAPALDPQTTQQRLIDVILAVFRRQTQTITLVLEDLHWADNESLTVLNHLTQIVGELPLLIVGSYRDDERHDLPTLLLTMQVLKLNRLTLDEITELSVSMLGNAARDKQINGMLQRETEGNVFFLIEVVRVLAEEAGQLDKIGEMTLPKRIFASGVQSVVKRRLNRVAAGNLPLLRYAAVIGRQIDLKVLRTLAPRLNVTDLDLWLVNCADAAVLDVSEGNWRFSHDKLREGLLGQLEAAERPNLHREVAFAIEATYPDVPEQNAALAYHFSQGEAWDKAVEYLTRAGDHAARLYAYADIRRFYGQLWDALARLLDTEDNRRKRVDAAIKLATGSFITETFESNFSRLETAEKLAETLPGADGKPGDRLRLARIHQWMGRLNLAANNMVQSIRMYQRALEEAQGSNDPELLGMPSSVIGRVLGIQGNYGKGIPLLRQAVAMLERSNNPQELAQTYAQLGTGSIAQGKYEEGVINVNKGIALMEQLKSLTGIGIVTMTASIGYLVADDPQQALAQAQRSVTATEASGDKIYLILGYWVRAWSQSRLGQHQAAQEDMERVQALAAQFGGRVVMADWQAASRAELAVNAGKYAETLPLAESAFTLAQSINSQFAAAIAQQAWGRALAALKRWDEADEHMQISVTAYENGTALLSMAHAYRDWGIITQQRGDIPLARQRLERAAAQYEASHTEWHVQRVRDLLAKLP